MKRRFLLKNKKNLDRLEILLEKRKSLDNSNALTFSGEEVTLIAEMTGLRSKKIRKIVKRFRLVMVETIRELVEEYKK